MSATLKDYKLRFEAVADVLRDTLDISYVTRKSSRWYKMKFYLFAVIPQIFRGKFNGRNAFLFRCAATYQILKERQQFNVTK